MYIIHIFCWHLLVIARTAILPFVFKCNITRKWHARKIAMRMCITTANKYSKVNWISIFQAADLVSYLREQIRGKDREIFLIVPQELDRNSLWKKETRPNETYSLSVSQNSSNHRHSPNCTVAVIHLNSDSEKKIGHS